MTATISSPDFLWGTATASYQVEGAVREDGRGESIWDTFSRTPGNVLHGHTGDVGADQYHRYIEDADLMARLGAQSYRFSIAWPRIYPAGKGEENPRGFDYYHRLTDALLERGIKPVATLYHWDLPQPLEDSGGWPERDTACRYADYAARCFDALGDKISMWITINEPFCASILGYQSGIHAPGRKCAADAVRAVHHLNLAHGLAVRRFREGGYKGKIGTTLNLSNPRPATNREEDILAADRAADRDSRMFIDPLYGRGYPERYLSAYNGLSVPVKSGDLETIAEKTDFLGINYYFENAVECDPEHPEGFRFVRTWQPRTAMGWDIVPLGLLRLLRWVHDTYSPKEIHITENGCAVDDMLSPDGNRCHDPARIDYLSKHLPVVKRAIGEGIPVAGYMLWSFIDNFEWAYGYTKRFGIVYCDHQDCRRIPKDSFFYYRDVIAGFEEL